VAAASLEQLPGGCAGDQTTTAAAMRAAAAAKENGDRLFRRKCAPVQKREVVGRHDVLRATHTGPSGVAEAPFVRFAFTAPLVVRGPSAERERERESEREDLVDSRGRWKRPFLQSNPMSPLTGRGEGGSHRKYAAAWEAYADAMAAVPACAPLQCNAAAALVRTPTRVTQVCEASVSDLPMCPLLELPSRSLPPTRRCL
jgi:hypothetical protein